MTRIKFSISLLFLVCSLWAVAGGHEVQDSIGTEQKDGNVFVQYLVSPGETIYRISTNYGVPISELMELNPSLENGLKVGQVIFIPYRPTMQHMDETNEIPHQDHDDNVVHTVQPGESLYSLSKKYKVSVGDLLKWNGMELKAGQKLVVGKKKTTSVDAADTKQEAKSEKVPENTVSKEPVLEEDPIDAINPEETITPTVVKTEVRQAEVKKEVYHYRFDPNVKQVMIVPFDPHLYFSDADDEIAKQSRIPRVKVREVFRRRLDALLDPPGYEVIHLMGGRSVDSLLDLNKIYSSVNYNYQEILESEYYSPTTDHAELDVENEQKKDEGFKGWVSKQKKKITGEDQVVSSVKHEKFEGKYFGVRVRNPEFFTYFKEKYSVDYYVFINEFQVMTDYEHCLDRTVQNYQREFVAHYSIFDQDGNQIAGNKFKVYYPSNSNDIMKIVADNVGKIAQRIIDDLPQPDER